MLVAESPEVKARVLRERMARFASHGRWRTIETALAADPTLPGLSELGEQVSQVRLSLAQAEEEQPVLADQAFQAELKRRRTRAEQRGDTRASDRYSAAIQTMEARLIGVPNHDGSN